MDETHTYGHSVKPPVPSAISVGCALTLGTPELLNSFILLNLLEKLGTLIPKSNTARFSLVMLRVNSR